MNLILCGMMGCGKTTIGRKIAEMSGRTFCDTDEEIVAKYGRITDIFARFGEARFREMETETVGELAQKDDLIIATGGGLTLKAENVTLLKANGKIVYLRAKHETLFSRLQKDSERPLLQSEKGLSERLTELLQARAPVYGRVADYTVDVDGKTPENIAAEIIAWADGE